MFFRSSRRERARDNARVADIHDAGTDEPLGQTQQLTEWRLSAQRVTRAWNAWLASEGRDRSVRYRAFVAALDDEERAAVEIERIIGLADAEPDVIDVRNSGLSVR